MAETSLCLVNDVEALGGQQRPGSSEVAALIVQLQRELLARARVLTGNPSDAQDLVQDTAVRALGFQGAPSATVNKSWLMRIMYNLFVDHYRSDKVRDCHASLVRLQAVDLLPEPPPLWDTLPSGALEAAMTQLPPASRVVFTLHTQGLPYVEIARKLGVPVATVGTRLLRARRRLRELLIAALRGPETGPGDTVTECPAPVSLGRVPATAEWTATSPV
jgi:RNA polymerase sigma-70 factor (ECF subfamily)